MLLRPPGHGTSAAAHRAACACLQAVVCRHNVELILGHIPIATLEVQRRPPATRPSVNPVATDHSASRQAGPMHMASDCRPFIALNLSICNFETTEHHPIFPTGLQAGGETSCNEQQADGPLNCTTPRPVTASSIKPRSHKDCMGAPVQHQQRRLVLHPQQLAQQPLKPAPACSHGTLSILGDQHPPARQHSSCELAAIKRLM